MNVRGCRLAALVVVGLLTGCATASSVGESVQGLFAPSPTLPPSSSERGAATAPDPSVSPRTGYAAKARVAVRRRAAAEAEVVGELARGEAVRRYQTVAGYVFVTTDAPARAGWVHERELTERRPASGASKAAPRPRPGAPVPHPPPCQQLKPPHPPTGRPGSAMPASEAGTQPTTDPAPEPPVKPRERSVFDPY
ncbi:MAG: hypothetical protein IPK07_03450 [Deltaproteobacteria bacterium]|nr:hypothetical protein [Deltaproteobacteria bacterium]